MKCDTDPGIEISQLSYNQHTQGHRGIDTAEYLKEMEE
jgi:hypothetical protein